MDNSIANKVIVTTGASSGMGEAAARQLAAMGASVVVAARRASRIEELAAEITRSGGKAKAVRNDMRFPLLKLSLCVVPLQTAVVGAADSAAGPDANFTGRVRVNMGCANSWHD